MSLTPQELVDNFLLLDEWEDRYGYIIDLGKQLEVMNPADKCEKNLLDGCVSQVWFVSNQTQGEDGKPILHFTADSDAVIVRGLISLLLELYQDRTPEEILALPIVETIQDIGLSSHLTVSRRDGFQAMVGFIRSAAEAYK